MSFSDLLSLFRQGKATGMSHMKNLIEMAEADGNLDHLEFDLLKSIGRRNGVSEHQITNIRRNPGAITFLAPQDAREKFSQLYDLVQMMTIDKTVHDEEKKLCNVFAIKLGYKRENVQELITAIESNLSNGKDVDETMRRCARLIV